MSVIFRYETARTENKAIFLFNLTSRKKQKHKSESKVKKRGKRIFMRLPRQKMEAVL
jgi:hypothetical protein